MIAFGRDVANISVGDIVTWEQIGSNARIKSKVELQDGKLIARRLERTCGVYFTEDLDYIKNRISKVEKPVSDRQEKT